MTRPAHFRILAVPNPFPLALAVQYRLPIGICHATCRRFLDAAREARIAELFSVWCPLQRPLVPSRLMSGLSNTARSTKGRRLAKVNVMTRSRTH